MGKVLQVIIASGALAVLGWFGALLLNMIFLVIYQCSVGYCLAEPNFAPDPFPYAGVVLFFFPFIAAPVVFIISVIKLRRRWL